MVHIRSREQTRGDARLPQTMPADRANLCADQSPRRPHTVRTAKREPRSWLRLRPWAIEAAHPWLALICEGSRARGGIVYLLRSPETHRRIQHPMRPKLQSFRTGGELTAPGLLRRHLGTTDGRTRRSRLTLVGHGLGSG